MTTIVPRSHVHRQRGGLRVPTNDTQQQKAIPHAVGVRLVCRAAHRPVSKLDPGFDANYGTVDAPAGTTPQLIQRLSKSRLEHTLQNATNFAWSISASLI